MEEGQQQQLQRSHVIEQTDQLEVKAAEAKMPLQSSPYLKYTDLQDYRRMGFLEPGNLSPKGGGAATAAGGITAKQATGIDKKLK
ncbi:hypothetical protein F511_14689 [Dorcoceras hygrometricum]|uniref:Uncharacterized protein n=1 Tax=Dorcoceras hygrometricum TaxID=472368 RepID=A0A2Z7BZ23_9LAMI|nr:hypothetical protein F511_14689 [Dorcoceras hygrometricum]